MEIAIALVIIAALVGVILFARSRIKVSGKGPGGGRGSRPDNNAH